MDNFSQLTFILGITLFFISNLVILDIRKKDPDLYQKLGGYKMFFFNSSTYKLLFYLLRRKYIVVNIFHPYDILFIFTILFFICIVLNFIG